MTSLLDTLLTHLSIEQRYELIRMLSEPTEEISRHSLAHALLPPLPMTPPSSISPPPSSPTLIINETESCYILKPTGKCSTKFALEVPISERMNITRPGRDLDELKKLEVPPGPDNGWNKISDPSSVNIKTVLPKFGKSIHSWNPLEFKILFAFERTDKRNIKCALLHIPTNKVIMTSATMDEPENIHTNSQMDGWYIYRSDMIAPSCFWNAFKDVI
jgi:hypothetical protein